MTGTTSNASFVVGDRAFVQISKTWCLSLKIIPDKVWFVISMSVAYLERTRKWQSNSFGYGCQTQTKQAQTGHGTFEIVCLWTVLCWCSINLLVRGVYANCFRELGKKRWLPPRDKALVCAKSFVINFVSKYWLSVVRFPALFLNFREEPLMTDVPWIYFGNGKIARNVLIYVLKICMAKSLCRDH